MRNGLDNDGIGNRTVVHGGCGDGFVAAEERVVVDGQNTVGVDNEPLVLRVGIPDDVLNGGIFGIDVNAQSYSMIAQQFSGRADDLNSFHGNVCVYAFDLNDHVLDSAPDPIGRGERQLQEAVFELMPIGLEDVAVDGQTGAAGLFKAYHGVQGRILIQSNDTGFAVLPFEFLDGDVIDGQRIDPADPALVRPCCVHGCVEHYGRRVQNGNGANGADVADGSGDVDVARLHRSDHAVGNSGNSFVGGSPDNGTFRFGINRCRQRHGFTGVQLGGYRIQLDAGVADALDRDDDIFGYGVFKEIGVSLNGCGFQRFAVDLHGEGVGDLIEVLDRDGELVYRGGGCFGVTIEGDAFRCRRCNLIDAGLDLNGFPVQRGIGHALLVGCPQQFNEGHSLHLLIRFHGGAGIDCCRFVCCRHRTGSIQIVAVHGLGRACIVSIGGNGADLAAGAGDRTGVVAVGCGSTVVHDADQAAGVTVLAVDRTGVVAVGQVTVVPIALDIADQTACASAGIACRTAGNAAGVAAAAQQSRALCVTKDTRNGNGTGDTAFVAAIGDGDI